MKGFTLIELLAVIVILAIIALIATPIVLSIINDSKESAVIRSAEFYVDAVENKIMQENMKEGGTLNPKECIVDSTGNVTCDGKYLEIEVNGQKPNSGSITFDKGKTTGIDLTFGDKNVSLNTNGELVLGDNIQICTLISGEANTIGSKYECKVKSGTKFNFYVLSHEEDGTTNLIMERNICDDGTVATEENTCKVAWISKLDYNDDTNYDIYGNNNKGPVTAMNHIYKATKDWNNIENIKINYEDENINYYTLEKVTDGYGTIRTAGNITQITKKDGTVTGSYENLKARLPRYDEVHGTGKCLTYKENGNKYGSCPLWLSNYLESNSYVTGEGLKNINGIYGYWTLSSNASSSSSAWYVSYYRYVNLSLVSSDDGYGVRPVINLKL